MTFAYFCKSATKYLLLISLSSINVIVNLSIQPFLIHSLFADDSFVKSSPIMFILFFTIYEITRILFSYTWDALTNLVSIKFSVILSLILLGLVNSLLGTIHYKNPTITLIMTLRVLNGIANNLHMYYLSCLSELFDNNETILSLTYYSQNIIGALFFFICIYLPLDQICFIEIFIGVVSAFSLLVFLIFFRCQCSISNIKSSKTKYYYQQNENEYMEKYNYGLNLSNQNNNNTQGNSLYNSNQKLRGPSNDNIQSLNINNITIPINSNSINKSKSLDSAVSKHFRHLNSESIADVKNANINASSSKDVQVTRKLKPKKKSSNDVLAQITTKYTYQLNSSHNHQKRTINLSFNGNNASSNNITTTPYNGNGTNGNAQGMITLHERKFKVTRSKIEKKKFFIVLLIYSMIYFNYNFSIFLFILRPYILKKNSIIEIFSLLSVYYLFQIIFSPMNKRIIALSVNSQKVQLVIFIFCFVFSIILTIFFNMTYFEFLYPSNFSIYFLFGSFVIKNETMIVMLGFCNIRTFAGERHEKKIKAKLKINTIISNSLIILFGLLWLNNYQITIINFFVLYGVMISFLVISFFLGIFGLKS